MDNDVLAYRVLLEKRKENAPFWEKKVLTVEEAAEYTGIGRTKIRQIIMRGDCPFAVTNGVQVCVIRDKFIDYESKRLFNSVQHVEIFIGLLCRLTKEKATILNRKENQRIVDMLVDLWMKLMEKTPEITQT